MELRDSEGRRTFLVASTFGLWGLIQLALLIPAAAYLLLPPRPKQDEEWIDAGDVGELRPGVPIEVVYRRNRVDGWRLTSEKSTAWVVRRPDGTVAAFAPQCTHLGCAYHWSDEKREFVCPCHASGFALDGRVLFGPAPRGLDRYEAKVEGGKLQLGPLVQGAPAGEAKS